MICPYSLSVPGGVQGQVLGLSRALRDAGHMVRIVAPCDGPPPDSGVTVIGTTITNESNGSVAPLSPDPPAQLRTIRTLWDESFDVVHLHEPLAPGPTVTALLMKSAPLVGTFHAAGEQPAYKALSGLARHLCARLDAKVAVSVDAREMVRVAVPDPWTVLFNGVEVEQFAEATPWDDGVDRPPSILFVGRHEERKGLGVLLEALEFVNDPVEVWIAGEGPQTEELRTRYGADRRLRWLGRISDEERNARMAAASVFVAPSLGGESFGVILLEAMAAGAPVVASSISGYQRVAGPLDDQPEAAILVEPGDAAALARGIVEALGDETRRAALLEAGRIRADHFSMRRLAVAYEQIYEAIRT